jgi:hypothetical protein
MSTTSSAARGAGARLDPRLRLVMLFLVPGFVGHTIQLTAEDVPWDAGAWERYWWTPGWHLYVEPWMVAAIAVLLGLAVLGMGGTAAWDAPLRRVIELRSARLWAIGVIVLYAAHYLTYPYRIRNHMSHMLASTGVIGITWLVLALREGRLDPRRADRLAMDGVALITCVTYFFAGLHKLNANFTNIAVDADGSSLVGSSAVDGLRTFFVYGDLGEHPPAWLRWVAAWGTIVIETCVPLIAWRVRRARLLAVATLCAFHVPHVAVMDVADYPMIASSFYPALFSRAEARIYAPFFRPSWWNVAGAALGVAIQVWFIPWWGRLTIFGIFVLAFWGWSLASIVHAIVVRRGKADAARGRPATAGESKSRG